MELNRELPTMGGSHPFEFRIPNFPKRIPDALRSPE